MRSTGKIAVILALPAVFAVVAAQQAPPAQQNPPAQGGGRGGGRGAQTPEQREASDKAAREKYAGVQRQVPARDSVWLEELSFLDARDAIAGGKTTALVLTGSTENNGPWMAGGKHWYALKLVGEATARKLGNALVAPIIPFESGNPENNHQVWGSIYLTQETFQAVVRDVANSLRGQGFKHVVLLGDSGGNTNGIKAVAAELGAKWTDAKIYHVPEFYNWTSKGGVRDFIQAQGIPEKSANADGIHDEYSLSAVMMAYDPKLISFDQRVKAGKATINGVPLEPKEKTIEMGKKIVEFRATVGAEAIKKAIGGGQ
jgi:creatinine amidohydrolase/Fe(II)-dependent formamide hydrolase-like protein